MRSLLVVPGEVSETGDMHRVQGEYRRWKMLTGLASARATDFGDERDAELCRVEDAENF